ncbi:hypothetical protein SFR_5060 [Streptomyces sp. FR-008]|nr:hypothetical protein SFR_5060 [Streptomyces sp. FR-008]
MTPGNAPGPRAVAARVRPQPARRPPSPTTEGET